MKCLEKERQSKDHQGDGQSSQPLREADECVRLTVKLRRKALLLRRNADKLDYLPSQLIYLSGQIFCLLQKLVRGFPCLLSANLIINCRLKKHGFWNMILNKNNALGTH